jgi:hypothetical protein
VAGDLAGLDSASALLLPHRDVGAPKRIQAEAGEVESSVARRAPPLGAGRATLQSGQRLVTTSLPQWSKAQRPRAERASYFAQL